MTGRTNPRSIWHGIGFLFLIGVMACNWVFIFNVKMRHDNSKIYDKSCQSWKMLTTTSNPPHGILCCTRVGFKDILACLEQYKNLFIHPRCPWGLLMLDCHKINLLVSINFATLNLVDIDLYVHTVLTPLIERSHYSARFLVVSIFSPPPRLDPP